MCLLVLNAAVNGGWDTVSCGAISAVDVKFDRVTMLQGLATKFELPNAIFTLSQRVFARVPLIEVTNNGYVVSTWSPFPNRPDIFEFIVVDAELFVNLRVLLRTARSMPLKC